jgi:transcription elongation factor Elf1
LQQGKNKHREMNDDKRFKDQHKVLADFYDVVWVICPSCLSKAVATLNLEQRRSRLVCDSCGLTKEVSITSGGATFIQPANQYFDCELWLAADFKGEVLWAYNPSHLEYLRKYIAASLRENTGRTGFSMTEKLPKFIQIAKNRAALLKLITKIEQAKVAGH